MITKIKRRDDAPAADSRAECAGTPTAVEGRNRGAENQQVIWQDTVDEQETSEHVVEDHDER
jgi:hypothetical protein